jgi:predicted TPR repeat methyltransferase
MASEATDKTFRVYNSQQAATYAKHRGQSYSSRILEIILNHHTNTGGKLGTLLDVGCGTGAAVQGLASRFQHATGVDPGEAMIAQATKLGGETSSGELIRYEVVGAENLYDVQSVKEGEVDLLVAAMAVCLGEVCHHTAVS